MNTKIETEIIKETEDPYFWLFDITDPYTRDPVDFGHTSLVKVNEFDFYAKVNLLTKEAFVKFSEMMFVDKIISCPRTNPVGHSVLLFEDIFELEKYIKEYPEMLKAEAR